MMPASVSDRVVRLDPFHVSANTDLKGDRSKRPQAQDPDMLLHVVKGAEHQMHAHVFDALAIDPDLAAVADRVSVLLSGADHRRSLSAL
jgi:hypothetical protein